MREGHRKQGNQNTRMHPRNKHKGRYNFENLVALCPELEGYLEPNPKGDWSINFFDPQAVKVLNKALLLSYYDLRFWDIPEGYLSPPIPGRADYIHHLADLLADSNQNKIPRGSGINILDIGTGANCIYPIIANREYGWSVTGSEVDEIAFQSAKNILSQNDIREDAVKILQQKNAKHIFEGIITKTDYFDCTLCNPPFYASAREADKASKRKFKNLSKGAKIDFKRNFGGQRNELWYEGGETAFIQLMIRESKAFSNNVYWFTTLVSKAAHLKIIYTFLKKEKVTGHKTINMGHANKQSRFIAWTFLNKKQQKAWQQFRWNKS